MLCLKGQNLKFDQAKLSKKLKILKKQKREADLRSDMKFHLNKTKTLFVQT